MIPSRIATFVAALVVPTAVSWVISPLARPSTGSRLFSTPFEAELYDNPYEGTGGKPSLAVPSNTKLVIGITKYSHDATICAADKASGKVLFAVSKERLTRRKHDAGNAAVLVDACLEALNLDLEAIDTVVMNNHHHRILPLENNLKQMEWEAGLNINEGGEGGYAEAENILDHCERRLELSHHLAHAYSSACQAPFNSGLVVVMDGMGETFRTMLHAIESKDQNYVSDLNFGLETFRTIPSNIREKAATGIFDYREAESVYRFTKNGDSIDLYPIWKRFQEEKTPPTLYNHGFENMDSVGALYSRVSSHIFGDWNACGKVMGLAPWAQHEWKISTKGESVKPILHDNPIVSGKLYEEGSLMIDRSLVEGMPCIARNDPDLFLPDGTRKKRYDFDESSGVTKQDRLPTKVALDAIALAHRMQVDCETVLMDFVRHFKEESGENNLCVSGGVALNSVLNGRLARELGFEQTYISPYPGDDGIAVGCCAFGLFGNKRFGKANGSPSLWSIPLSPYLGADPSEAEMKVAIDKAEPWLQVEVIRKERELLKMIVDEIESGGVVALYQSRSELGPRALGHRSILADPRKKGLIRFINEKVKSRESFRPFAPSVLLEEAHEWFHLGDDFIGANVSPYMSMTAMVREDKRESIPAVTHVDGSSRLQTVAKDAEPFYHKLISMFFERTGVPMVLNTSFNTLPGEPIVETPEDAIRSFLCSLGSIEILIMGPYVITRKLPDVKRLLGEANKDGLVKSEPVCPIRTGRLEYQISFALETKSVDDEESVETKTVVRMVDRPMHHHKNEWFSLLDDLESDVLTACDGSITLEDIMTQYAAQSDDDSIGKEDDEETQTLLQNLVKRFVRLYEYTFISW
jgi:carbamoyltransferase